MTPTAEFAHTMHEVVHAMKTPIAAAKGSIELAQLKGPLNAEQEKFTNRALEALGKLERLVQLVLEAALLESDRPLQLELLSLNEMVADTLLQMDSRAEEQEIALQFEPLAEDDEVEADYRLLFLVLDNLLSNAIKYNHRHGAVEVRLVPEATHVRIRVRDTGKGIPPADLPRIFDRYFRSTRDWRSGTEGHGLGLAITKGILDKHGGTIAVESTLDVGSTFEVRLPRRQPAAHRSAPEPLDGVDDRAQEPQSDPAIDADDPQTDTSRLR